MDISELKNKIISGESLSVLKNVKNGTFDLVITSPPYFQQRDYGNGNSGIGNEKIEEEYLENLMNIFRECVRVTNDKGAVVFNIGDKYINGGLSLIPYKFAIRAVEDKKVFLLNQLTWSKLNPTPRQEKRKLIQATEPFFGGGSNPLTIFRRGKYSVSRLNTEQIFAGYIA